VFNVLKGFLQVVNPLNFNAENGIQRNLPLDECLSVKEALRISLEIIHNEARLIFCQCRSLVNKLLKMVVNLNLHLTNDAVLSLTVGSAIDEENS